MKSNFCIPQVKFAAQEAIIIQKQFKVTEDFDVDFYDKLFNFKATCNSSSHTTLVNFFETRYPDLFAEQKTEII